MKRDQPARLRRPSPGKFALKFAERAKAIWGEQRGVAAIEFGIFAIFLSLAFVNVTDVSIYI
jgi:Flp pilus assembly protein TadG